MIQDGNYAVTGTAIIIKCVFISFQADCGKYGIDFLHLKSTIAIAIHDTEVSDGMSAIPTLLT